MGSSSHLLVFANLRISVWLYKPNPASVCGPIIGFFFVWKWLAGIEPAATEPIMISAVDYQVPTTGRGRWIRYHHLHGLYPAAFIFRHAS